VVGGTHYYIQALLFKDHTIESEQNDQTTLPNDYTKHPILGESTEIILTKLRDVDPVMANRWHPNDRRKIQRSLQIYLETGKPASETYMARLQEESSGDVAMRFPVLMLWPHCEREAHKVRLDRRVDRMLDSGLLDEVAQLMNIRKAKHDSGETVDYTKGIWQAIGFRQFEPYQQALTSRVIEQKELDRLKKAAVEQTQASTRRYAASQLKWIRIKLLNALVRANAMPNLFVLDGTDLNCWNSSVIEPALQITQKFLDCKELPDPKMMSPLAAELLAPPKEDLTYSPENWGVQTCEVCGTKAATPQLWKMHLQSRGHKIKVSKKKAWETKVAVPVEQQEEAKGD
jgi:tRNA dimethylallyltransferase